MGGILYLKGLKKPMKIKSISNHSPSVKEVKALTKVSNQFAGWRTVSKTLNFSILFSATPPTIGKHLENAGYTEKEALNYLKLINCLDFYQEQCNKLKGKMPKKKIAFLCAATKMYEAYNRGFPGVGERALREKEFAWKNGYVRLWHGAVKHLPELLLMQKDKTGLVGADRKLWSSMFSNLNNEAGNAPIQCLEANVAIRSIINEFYYSRIWKLHSYLWNMTHDSVDWNVRRDELGLVCSLINACASYIREPYFNIKMTMDFSISDPAKGKQKNYYHTGLENPFKVDPIEVAVEKYNKLHPNQQPIKWEGCIC